MIYISVKLVKIITEIAYHAPMKLEKVQNVYAKKDIMIVELQNVQVFLKQILFIFIFNIIILLECDHQCKTCETNSNNCLSCSDIVNRINDNTCSCKKGWFDDGTA